MSRWVFLLCLCCLGACQREPGFDERYAMKSRELAAKARTMQSELQNQLAADAEAERARAEAGIAPASLVGNSVRSK